MKVLIIEDEPRAAEKLIRSLHAIDNSIHVNKVLGSVIASVNYLKEHQVDLILSDIHLSDGLSFEIFEILDIQTPVIFTTAYDAYAIKAFTTNSIDYLLKPIRKTALEFALNKFRRLNTEIKPDKINFEGLVKAVTPVENYKSRFLVEASNGELKSVAVEEIAYFYADGKYTFLKTTEDRKYYCRTNISGLEGLVDPKLFFQLNRKYIVHIGCIARIMKYSKSRLKIILKPQSDDEVIVSNERARLFKQWLDGN